MGSAVTRRRPEFEAHGPGTADDAWDVIDGDDVVGTASARLLSTCADRAERLAALSLLGLLLDHADEAGRIRLPLDALARELDVEHDRAVRLLQHLVVVEAVHAEGDAVVVVGDHSGGSALAPSRFLANLMTVLEREPAGSAPGHTGPVRKATGAWTQPEPRSGRRFLVALGVGVAAMALATAPSGDPVTSLRSVSAPEAPTGRAPWATAAPAPTPTTLVTGEGPEANAELGPAGIDGPARGQSPASRDEASEVARQPGAAADEPGVSRPAPRVSEPSPPELQPSPEGPPASPSPPAPPPVPAPADRPATAADPAVACPSGGPEARVSGTSRLGAGPSNVLDLVGERILQVTGTVVNTSQAAVTVVTVEISAGQGADREVESAGTVPVAIPPGGTATWETRLLAGGDAPSETRIDVRVTDWSWVEPSLDATCAS